MRSSKTERETRENLTFIRAYYISFLIRKQVYPLKLISPSVLYHLRWTAARFHFLSTRHDSRSGMQVVLLCAYLSCGALQEFNLLSVVGVLVERPRDIKHEKRRGRLKYTDTKRRMAASLGF